ncbi:MAG TPA: hypothetical protein P5270_03780 [Victivallales bacterium]|nr:hypothetical protein [Victivallales bacterium]HRR28460.1 hypothetical protein [Victivallales bacterium]
MPIITCTYCGAEISASEVEAEDGHCPECGAIITLGRSNFGDEDEEELNDGFFEEEEEEEDIFDDDEEEE